RMPIAGLSREAKTSSSCKRLWVAEGDGVTCVGTVDSWTTSVVNGVHPAAQSNAPSRPTEIPYLRCMATIRPFAGIRFAPRPELDFSSVIAPPYDVLDEAGKAALQAKHPNNIVNVDLPWLPPKTVGPDEAYERANVTLQAWLSAGILKRDPRPAIYSYTQSYEHAGKTFHRRGLIATVRLSPFGQGQVVPHEKTYPSAIEDRLKLMRATGMQLSPIFGLFSDPRSEVTKLLYANLGLPQHDGTLNGVRNQLWELHDNDVANKISELLGTKPIYIADGHHRYTTALQYQKEMEEQNPGAPGLPPNHPANFCMF